MEHSYKPDGGRYGRMKYRRCGRSGLLLPELSFGLWQNFGTEKTKEERRELILTAFDLANNYGFPAAGAAEENFGEILREDLKGFRDELIISTKAGYEMWPGPYGNWGSRKYLMASIDQSLRRMGLEYVDIFYHHRPDPETPLEETMEALSDIGRQARPSMWEFPITGRRRPGRRRPFSGSFTRRVWWTRSVTICWNGGRRTACWKPWRRMGPAASVSALWPRER